MTKINSKLEEAVQARTAEVLKKRIFEKAIKITQVDHPTYRNRDYFDSCWQYCFFDIRELDNFWIGELTEEKLDYCRAINTDVEDFRVIQAFIGHYPPRGWIGGVNPTKEMIDKVLEVNIVDSKNKSLFDACRLLEKDEIIIHDYHTGRWEKEFERAYLKACEIEGKGLKKRFGL